MAVWRLQVNTGGTNVAEYCLKIMSQQWDGVCVN